MYNELKENEIFIFGSNEAGQHYGWAAKQAHEQFWAEMWVGEWLTGKCYAFQTLTWDRSKRTGKELKESIKKLVRCAEENKDEVFLLTKVWCGIAWYDEEYIKTLFKQLPKNIIKPEDWED